MSKVPGTQKTELQKTTEALEEEIGKWQALGIDHNSTVHPPASIYDLKVKFMALRNIVAKKLEISDDEFNLEYQKLMLKDMQELRSKVETGRAAVDIPKIGILGPNGELLNGL